MTVNNVYSLDSDQEKESQWLL